MAIVKFFPTKTATIYSQYPNKNTGLDEITDLSLYNSLENPHISRTLIQFDQTELLNFIEYKDSIRAGNYKAYVKLYLANASEIPLDYSIYGYPISSSWDMGTGRLANLPETVDGVSWKSRKPNIDWDISILGPYYGPSGSVNVTASYINDINSVKGGGNWYTDITLDSNLNNYILSSSQNFNYLSNKDIELDATLALEGWFKGWFPNDGYIIKHDKDLEFNSSSFETKYFTSNTHTIYPPCLELRWEDFRHTTGSLTTVTSSFINVTLGNNKGEFQQDSIQRFKVNVREKYPTRVFQTSSLYLNNRLLPITSYWSIKDYDTEEIIFDYDENYTKISANSEGNYFDIYLNGLEPERYYKILIKTILPNGEVVVLDDNNIFKVIR